jgi:hypothetical protein
MRFASTYFSVEVVSLTAHVRQTTMSDDSRSQAQTNHDHVIVIIVDVDVAKHDAVTN